MEANGYIKGLSAGDLQTWQLEKLNHEALIDLITEDIRIEPILCKIVSESTDANFFKMLNTRMINSAFNNYILLKNAYNDKVKSTPEPFIYDARYGYVDYPQERKEFVVWSRLNDENRKIEICRWLDNQSSIVYAFSLDWPWLEKDEYLSNKVAEKIVQSNNGSIGPFCHNVSSIMLEKYEKQILEYLLSNKSFDVASALLQNSNSIDSLIIAAFRTLSKTSNIRVFPQTILAPIKKSHFSALPSVTRLKLLENLCEYKVRKINLIDIKTDEDLQPLLFGVSLKYNYRAARVVRDFNLKFLNQGVRNE